MALALTDLFAPQTKDEVLESILDIAKELGLPTTAWQPGSVGRTILAIVAQKISDLTQVTSLIARGGLLDYATGNWLRLLARSVYGVEFIAATFGSTTVTLTNDFTANYDIEVGDLHFSNNVTGAKYTINESATVTVVAGDTLDVTVISDLAGSDSNANANEITELVTTLQGVTCTNATALVGLDDETDEDLRQRCRDKLAALSPNGAADAYSYFAKSSVREDGSAIGITRVRTLGDSTVSQVTVYLATASGVVTGTAGDTATDLGAVDEILQTKVVPTGITAEILSASLNSILVTPTVYVAKTSTLTTTEVKTLVLAKLNAYFATIPIGGFDIGGGGKVFVDALIGQIYQASPFIVQVTIAAPALDVPMNEDDVAACTSVAGDITVVQLS